MKNVKLLNFHALRLLLNTIRYLKIKQIYYQLFYRLRHLVRGIRGYKYSRSKESKSFGLKLQQSIPSIPSYNEKSFTFLNQTATFNEKIDWNCTKFGKLWTYNLNYFDYLNQDNFSVNLGISLINNFIDAQDEIIYGFEPFPISIRGINWIKFLTKQKINDHKINNSLLAQYYILKDNLEYHLLGNHLLENGFSLLFGAYYFSDIDLLNVSKSILKKELKEQILQDGAHFELSPMYHQLMLFRLMDCINLIDNNSFLAENSFNSFLKERAELMLRWLNIMTFRNGHIPLFNDSAIRIAPKTKELNNYGMRLGLNVIGNELKLKQSGYRKVVEQTYECIIDVGNIGPDYIPGHAHADTFNFELHIKEKSFIVDTGTSTYENCIRRQLERSTSSHNTVEIDNLNQSEVWGSFRVGHRAKIISLDERQNSIEGSHDGYKRVGARHIRKFEWSESKIIIEDKIISDNVHECKAFFHFHPRIKPIITESKVFTDVAELQFFGFKKIFLKDFEWASGFNKTEKASVIVICFENNLKTEINTYAIGN